MSERKSEIQETIDIFMGKPKPGRIPTALAIPFWGGEIYGQNYPNSIETEDTNFAIGWRSVCDLLCIAREVLEEEDL